MKHMYGIWMLVVASAIGCGGGGINVLSGLVNTEIVADVSSSAATSSGYQTAASVELASEFSLSSITSAILHIEAIEYLFADVCDRSEAADFKLVRLPGPFRISLLDQQIEPTLEPIEAEIDLSLCRTSLLPFKPAPLDGRPNPGLVLAGTLPDTGPYHIGLPAPPPVHFRNTEILVDAEEITVELQLPVQAWLTRIETLLEEDQPVRPGPGQPLRIDEEQDADLTDRIIADLDGEGSMRRK